MKKNSGPFKLAIFDLDGTLIDSKEDIANSVHATMAALNLAEIPAGVILSYVGRGVEPLIRQVLSGTGRENSVKEALTIFRAHYQAHLLDNTLPYPDVIKGLQTLNGTQKAVLSNKSEKYVKKIIAGLHLDHYFTGLYGGDSFATKKPDPAGVNYVLEKTGVTRETAIIIGDSGVDMETGKRAGIKTCGVTYGYRSTSELESSGADFIVHTFKEAIAIIRGGGD